MVCTEADLTSQQKQTGFTTFRRCRSRVLRSPSTSDLSTAVRIYIISVSVCVRVLACFCFSSSKSKRPAHFLPKPSNAWSPWTHRSSIAAWRGAVVGGSLTTVTSGCALAVLKRLEETLEHFKTPKEDRGRGIIMRVSKGVFLFERL